ncbi:CPW-WPC family protein [Plasmodium ovale wallikeri]|uniref:CPW-WPC family protein n=1 Tax=Plasmodium ovale wallikeri TaxID=864142 RepID=A0A1A8Z106_PLAOA|nr:CPW-WPC family protein [Plasmodium ovale wallikeri]SBT38325.1 CPW-WPC family protein [Plasmodium ovale wallikeri]
MDFSSYDYESRIRWANECKAKCCNADAARDSNANITLRIFPSYEIRMDAHGKQLGNYTSGGPVEENGQILNIEQ